MEDRYESIELDEDLNPLMLSMGQYRLFMKAGNKGAAAMHVYLHLMFTARLQQTNQVRANANYIQAGTSMGRDKVKAAKAWLHSKGMIEYLQRPGPDGKLGETYIRLRYMPSAEAHKKLETSEAAETEPSPPAETPEVEELQDDKSHRRTSYPTDGESAPNALSEQGEMLKVSKLASPPAENSTAEEAKRLLHCSLTEADRRFVENVQQYGLTEKRKPIFDKISAKHPPRAEVAKEEPEYWEPDADVRERQLYNSGGEGAYDQEVLAKIYSITGCSGAMALIAWMGANDVAPPEDGEHWWDVLPRVQAALGQKTAEPELANAS